MKKISILPVFTFAWLIVLTSGGWAQVADTDGDGVNDFREGKDGTDLNSATSFNPLSKGLVAYYPFSGDASDQSGWGNHGVVQGATLVEDRFGFPAQAYQLDGLDDFIRVQDATSLKPANSLTLSAWFYIDKPQRYRRIVTKGLTRQIPTAGSSHGSYQLITGSYLNDQLHDEPLFTLATSVSGYKFPDPAAGLGLGSWHHVIGTYDGTTARLYHNGSLVAQMNVSGDFVYDNNALLFGKDEFYNQFFEGKLDNIRIYRKALSSSEVAQLYAAESQVSAPLVKIFAPTNTPVRLAIGPTDITNVTAPILPFGWKFDAASGQLFGRMIGTNPISALLTGERGTNPTVPVSVPVELLPQVGQSIAFTARASVKVGNTIPLLTTSSSKLPVSVTSSDPNILRVDGSNSAALSKGRVTLTATQDGNEKFAPATPIKRTVVVR